MLLFLKKRKSVLLSPSLPRFLRNIHRRVREKTREEKEEACWTTASEGKENFAFGSSVPLQSAPCCLLLGWLGCTYTRQAGKTEALFNKYNEKQSARRVFSSLSYFGEEVFVSRDELRIERGLGAPLQQLSLLSVFFVETRHEDGERKEERERKNQNWHRKEKDRMCYGVYRQLASKPSDKTHQERKATNARRQGRCVGEGKSGETRKLERLRNDCACV